MLFFLIPPAVIVLDQLLKFWVKTNLQGGSAVLVPGVLHLVYAENTGAAFGMFRDGRVPLILFTFAVMGIFIYLLWKRKIAHPVGYLALSFIAGGAVGNLLDRLIRGYVIDMFELQFIRFAIFNLADAFITVGCVLLAVFVIFYERFHRVREGEGHEA